MRCPNAEGNRAPHEHSWQDPEGQCVVKLAIFADFGLPKGLGRLSLNSGIETADFSDFTDFEGVIGGRTYESLRGKTSGY